MSDQLDEADRYVELLLQQGLSNKAHVPVNTGTCLALHCLEPTEGAFCSAECREDYEKIARLRIIQGLA